MSFKLRAWSPDDLPSLVRNANNPAIAGFMNDQFPHPYTKETGRNFIAMASQESPLHIFAIEVEGEAVGGIGIHPRTNIERKNAEMGYWLGEPFWGRGIITEAVKQLVAYGFQTFDINRIFARPFGTNLASQRVLEKAGFKLEGRFEKTFIKNGEYLDELVYAVRRPE
ncbi:GNAT family N-acetyltransferase [Hymenobacter taeanensis]|uniref:GNAT family N-acetyltransferase n=1 Tax=Hymenobacter taeanensis TaxID=2735321 RepID=A0A6M6BI46_9BACT|nr:MULTISPECIES: GNAT family protein [Hymenobacter]QJX47776.1 GNAT family N-acetyltransferase [Hymenobacter taeanensis]UOQ82735.1 GNAT family N-acetyltransferase [Hymenobacter sp. 5414T-23]